MKPQPINGEEHVQESSDELYERFNLVVDKGQEPLRIDKFLMGRIERATRNKLQQAYKCRPRNSQWKRGSP
jgi:23S rRNA pseudouridine1911/1915/1917 synthase